jgi:Sec-independent protein translocase protein TatA
MRAALIIILCLFIAPMIHADRADDLLRDVKKLHEDVKREIEREQAEDRAIKEAELARMKHDQEEQRQMAEAFIIGIGFVVLIWLWKRKPN